MYAHLAAQCVLLFIAGMLFIGLRNERAFNCRAIVIDAIAKKCRENAENGVYDQNRKLWNILESKTYNQCLWSFTQWTSAAMYPELKDIL